MMATQTWPRIRQNCAATWGHLLSHPVCPDLLFLPPHLWERVHMWQRGRIWKWAFLLSALLTHLAPHTHPSTTPHTPLCYFSPSLLCFQAFSLVTMERVLFPFPPKEGEQAGGGVVAEADCSRPLGRGQVFLTPTGDGAAGGLEGVRRRIYRTPSPLLPAGPAGTADTCSHSRLNSHIYHHHTRCRRCCV